MDPLTNPYVPGAGTRPPELAGRDQLLAEADIAVKRNMACKFARSYLFIGLRGVGKTVLLNEVQKMATKAGALTDFIEVQRNLPLPISLVTSFRMILLQLDQMSGVSRRVKQGLRILKSFARTVKVNVYGVEFSIDTDEEPGTADSGVLSNDLIEVFLSAGRAAEARKRSIVIVIDEIHNLPNHEFEALIVALHRVNQKQLPLLVVGAGLPALVKLSGSTKTYAERLFEFINIDSLDSDAAGLAITKPASDAGVTFTEDAVSKVVKLTGGYPYFLQEWGYQIWNMAEQTPIGISVVADSSVTVFKRLDRNFFAPRYDRLSDSQKEYLHAMAKCGPGPHATGHIAKSLNTSSNKLGSVRDNLIANGMLYSPRYGETAFTIPQFDQFLIRINR